MRNCDVIALPASDAGGDHRVRKKTAGLLSAKRSDQFCLEAKRLNLGHILNKYVDQRACA
jgi:hypothetical protein